MVYLHKADNAKGGGTGQILNLTDKGSRGGLPNSDEGGSRGDRNSPIFG